MATKASPISKAYFNFAGGILLDAHHDSPAEIQSWCKSDLCRLLCTFYGIDINQYKQAMIMKCLEKLGRKPITGKDMETQKFECKVPSRKNARIKVEEDGDSFAYLGPLFSQMIV